MEPSDKGPSRPPESSKTSFSSSSSSSSEEPRNARIISVLLQSMGVEACEPRVIHQLLEFFHRYVIEILQDSLVYAEHANRTELDMEDVRLAIQARVNYSFAPPPSREMTMALAAERNKEPLPIILDKNGIRLPPEKYCLTSINYRPLPKLNQAAKKAKTAAVPTPTPQKMVLTAGPPPAAGSMPPPPPKAKALFQEEENYDEEDTSKKRKREEEA